MMKCVEEVTAAGSLWVEVGRGIFRTYSEKMRGKFRSKLKYRILLPSVRHLEERLTVSQSVRQSGKQSVSRESRRADRQAETHSLAFFSGGLQLQAVGNLRPTGRGGEWAADGRWMETGSRAVLTQKGRAHDFAPMLQTPRF